MAIVRTMQCTGCGEKHTVICGDQFDHPLGHRCDDCVRAERVRGQLGEGEHADQLMALLYPNQFARERRMEQWVVKQKAEIRRLLAERQKPDAGR